MEHHPSGMMSWALARVGAAAVLHPAPSTALLPAHCRIVAPSPGTLSSLDVLGLEGKVLVAERLPGLFL